MFGGVCKSMISCFSSVFPCHLWCCSVFILQVGVVAENSISVLSHPNTSFSNYEMNKSLPPTCNSNFSGHHSGGSLDKNALYEPERSAILTGLSHNSDNAGEEWKSGSYTECILGYLNWPKLGIYHEFHHYNLTRWRPSCKVVCSLTTASWYLLFLCADDLWWSIHVLQMYCQCQKYPKVVMANGIVFIMVNF